jgi:hypothetical protein
MTRFPSEQFYRSLLFGIKMAEANRPPSRNADIQTDVTDDFPPLFQDRANKQVRSNEKSRHTKLITGIEKHRSELGSRTELKFMRKNLANQLEECIRAHNIFWSSSTQRLIPVNDWVTNLEQVTTACYARIDDYIRNVPRAPSTASSIHSLVSLPSHLSESKNSTHFPDSHHSSIISISPSQKTTRVLTRELAEEKVARQNLQCELQRLQATIAQIDQQYANEAIMRTQTINGIAEDNRNLAAWLKERNEALAKEQQERQNLEATLKTDLRNQQRLLEDEKRSCKRKKFSFNESWRFALANSLRLSTKN